MKCLKAGIIAAKGKLKGVAPDARITAYKVLNAHGTGKQSDILAGLETAVDPANPYRADIVNMSLGAPSDGTDPITQAAINAVEAGIVVVATAGNNGPGYQTLNQPGAAKDVLTVGASTAPLNLPQVTLLSPKREELKISRKL